MLPKTKKGLTQKTIAYIVLFALAVTCIIPFWIVLTNATRSNTQISAGVSLVPGSHFAKNLDTLVNGKINPVTGERGEGWNVFRGLLNSLILASSTTFLSAYFSAMTAFGFAFYRFRGGQFLWRIVLAVMMVPTMVGLIGFYKLISGLGMVDTWWPLILPSIANSFGVFYLRQYYKTSLPMSLIEAMRIDGASELRIFHRLGIPMAMPGIATMSILGFIGNWNSFLLPLVVLNSQSLFPMPVLISRLNPSIYARDLGAVYLGLAVSIIPILIIFLIFSRQLVASLGLGSVKE